jgi:hypothetical protein
VAFAVVGVFFGVSLGTGSVRLIGRLGGRPERAVRARQLRAKYRLEKIPAAGPHWHD